VPWGCPTLGFEKPEASSGLAMTLEMTSCGLRPSSANCAFTWGGGGGGVVGGLGGGDGGQGRRRRGCV
jgi:hypothetical protein